MKDDEVILLPEDDEVELLPEEESEKSFVDVGREAMKGGGPVLGGMFNAPEVPDASDVITEDPEVLMTREMAARFGAQNGLTGGWKKNVKAAASTVDEIIEGVSQGFMKQGMQGVVDGMPDISETFKANLNAEKAIDKKAMEKYPSAYLMGDLAGTLAGEVATFGLAKAAKGGKALKGFEALAAQTGFGLVHGLGRTEEDTIMGMAGDAAIEGAISAVPVGAQMFRGSKLGTKAATAIASRAEETMVPAFLRFLGAKATTFENSVKEFGKDAVGVIQRALNIKNADGADVIRVTAPRKQVLEDVSLEVDNIGREMKKFLVETDEMLPVGVDPMGARNLFSKLKTEIFNADTGIYKTLDQKKLASFQGLEEDMYKNLFDTSKDTFVKETGETIKNFIPRENINFSSLHDHLSDQFRYSRGAMRMDESIAKDKMLVRKKIAQVMHGHLDDQIEIVGDVSKLNKYKEIRTRFGDLKTVEDALDASMGKNKAKELLRTFFREKLFVVGSMAGAAGLSTQNPYVGTGLAVASALSMVATSRRINGIVANGAKRVATAIRSNPDAYGDLAAQLAAASSISADAFMDQLYLASSVVELKENPMARTSEDVYKRKAQILTIVEDINPDLAGKLRSAIDKSNTVEIGSIMTQLSAKAPPGLIQQGIGWDGIAWDPGEQQAVEQSLRKHLTPREQTLLIPRFREDKKIPPEYYDKASPNPINRLTYIKRRNKIDKPVI